MKSKKVGKGEMVTDVRSALLSFLSHIMRARRLKTQLL